SSIAAAACAGARDRLSILGPARGRASPGRGRTGRACSGADGVACGRGYASGLGWAIGPGSRRWAGLLCRTTGPRVGPSPCTTYFRLRYFRRRDFNKFASEGKLNMRRVLVFLSLLPQPASSHDWYTGTKDPYTHGECCGNKDCHPVSAEVVQRLENG